MCAQASAKANTHPAFYSPGLNIWTNHANRHEDMTFNSPVLFGFNLDLLFFFFTTVKLMNWLVFLRSDSMISGPLTA